MDDDEAALAHVGKTVADKYRLLCLLGCGGMGAVYEAEHVFTKRRVALKRMHPNIARSKLAAERFIRESQAPSSIGHPGIVQVLDGGFETDGSLYLVLELLDGVSMHDAIEAETLDAAAIVRIASDLLDALAAAHDKGFIHRDIKPDNVFLAHDGRGSVTVKLLDFGIASLRTDGDAKLTQTGAVLGTPHYMSPEQAKGARLDARSDLWSVGAMLYRALAGRAPYQGDTYNALIVSIVTEAHAPLAESCPELPSALLDVVERALQKAPEARFDSAEAMAMALRCVRFRASDAAVARVPELPTFASLRPRSAEKNATVVRGRRAAQAEGLAAPAAVSGVAAAASSADVKPATRATVVRARPAARAPRSAPSPRPEPLPVSVVAEQLQPSAAAVVEVRREPRVSARAPSPRPGEYRAQQSARWPGLSLLFGLCVLAAVAVFALRSRSLLARNAVAQLTAASARPPDEVRVPTPGPERQQPTAAEKTSAQAPEGERDAPANAQAPRASTQPAQPAAHPPEGLSAETLSRVLGQQTPELQHCLEESVVAQMLAGGAKAEACRLDVELHVAASGRVTSVAVRGNAPANLSQCVQARLQTAQFPAAEAETVFRYPLVLSPQIVGQ